MPKKPRKTKDSRRRKFPGQFHNPARFVWDEDTDIVPFGPAEPEEVERRTPEPTDPPKPRTPRPRKLRRHRGV